MKQRLHLDRRLLWLIAATTVYIPVVAKAQEKVILVGQTLGVDAEETLGLESGSNPSVDNAELLYDGLLNPNTNHAVAFGGGQYYFDKTIRIPARPSHSILASGRARSGNASTTGVNNSPQRGVFRWNGRRTVFDGTTITASTNGVSDTITLGGSSSPTVSSDDVPFSIGSVPVGSTLWIEGGDNFTTGVYVIESVDVGNNTWTLDRDCCTGAASGMTGYAGGTMMLDPSYGLRMEGIYFLGRTIEPSPPVPTNDNAAIGYHALRSVNPSATTPNTSKCMIDGCVFGFCQVGILAGESLVKFGEKAADYSGASADHADSLVVNNVGFLSCDTAIAVRNNLSIGNRFTEISATNCNRIFYLERGGDTVIDGVELGNGQSPIVLQIGGVNQNRQQITMKNVRLDAQVGEDFQILAMDGTSNLFGQINIHGLTIPNTSGGGAFVYNVPIMTVVDGFRLHLTDAHNLRPGSIKLKKGGSGYTSSARVDNCSLSGTFSNPGDLIHEDSDVGCYAEITGCYSYNGSIRYESGIFVKGATPEWTPYVSVEIPSSDPSVTGEVWNDNGTLKVSDGS